jgi:molybdopterin/thiamine biosynthesis adenylyltransferase
MLGEAGQERLKGTTAFISRCGGLGGQVALSLAAAGVGRLIIAHAGNVRASDLNRQILMTHDWIGRPRIESIARRLAEFNPRLRIEAVAENVSEANVRRLVEPADLVFDCAPLFQERFLMNREAVRQGKPMIEAAVYAMEGQVTTIVPGKTPCLACIYPEMPPMWKRQFPVLGAVPALIGQIAALEGIKIAAGLGATLAGTLMYCDTATLTFQRIAIERRPDCPVCGAAGGGM